MRLEEYIINEAMSPEEAFMKALPKIKKECRPFIMECKKNGIQQPIWRGSGKNIKNLKKIRARKNRFPKDTPSEAHEYLDGLFKRYHGIYVRSEGVFTTGSYNNAKQYGIPYIFVPVGKYRYFWSDRIMDLFSDIVETEYSYDILWGDDVYHDWEIDYESKYGEGTGNGRWFYKKYESDETYRDDAAEDITKEMLDDLDMKDGEDDNYQDEYDRIYYEIFYHLEWEPDVSYEEYAREKTDEVKAEAEDYVETTIRNYKDTKDLKKYIGRYAKHELTFICDYYYLINLKLGKLYDKYILGLDV